MVEEVVAAQKKEQMSSGVVIVVTPQLFTASSLSAVAPGVIVVEHCDSASKSSTEGLFDKGSFFRR